jgi:CRISPR type III-B/RAMP module-associated protein Cmr5
MSRIDIDRKRASYAFRVVSGAKSNKAYGTQVEKLPMMIHNSGLRNTLAFAYAKGYLSDKDKGKEWRQVFTHLINWFSQEDPTGFFVGKFESMSDDSPKTDKPKAEKNLKCIIELEDDAQYRFATHEVLALANWMRKLVKGEEVNHG